MTGRPRILLLVTLAETGGAQTYVSTLVPAGVLAVHSMLPQLTRPPPPKMRERKLPDAAYGVMRIQSTLIAAPPALYSLRSGRMPPVIATLWVATS